MTGLNVETVYNEINKESGGVYYASSQSSELRDTRQVKVKNKRQKEQRNEHTGIVRRIISDNNTAAF